MELEVEMTCPFGHKCEEAKDGKISRCMMYIKIRGKDPQTGEDIDNWNCAFVWQPIIAIEGNGQARSLVHTFSSMRNAALENQKLLGKQNGNAETDS